MGSNDTGSDETGSDDKDSDDKRSDGNDSEDNGGEDEPQYNLFRDTSGANFGNNVINNLTLAGRLSGQMSSDGIDKIPCESITDSKDPAESVAKQTESKPLPDDVWSRSVGDEYTDQGERLDIGPPEPPEEEKVFDPHYVDSLDLDDDNVDIDLDKVDFSDSAALQPGMPEEIVIESEPGLWVEDTRAIPVTIVTREEWGALPRPEGETPLKHKVPYLRMEYWTDTEPCFNKEDCIQIVQRIQKKHIDEGGMTDIRYNFLIGGDGNAYEGRGWNVQPQKSDVIKKYEGKYFEFAYIGDYRDEFQTDEHIKGQWGLIGEGLEFNYLEQDFDFIQ